MPEEILSEYCETADLPEPVWESPTRVVVGGTTYDLKQFGEWEGGMMGEERGGWGGEGTHCQLKEENEGFEQ